MDCRTASDDLIQFGDIVGFHADASVAGRSAIGKLYSADVYHREADLFERVPPGRKSARNRQRKIISCLFREIRECFYYDWSSFSSQGFPGIGAPGPCTDCA